MPFFPQAYLAQQDEPTFFQLLSALDGGAQQKSCPARRQQQQQTPRFNPRFDVAETPEAYELFGEVPGLEQDALSIEFSDAQTLVVKGKTERAPVTVKQQEQEQSTQRAEKAEKEIDDNASEKSHNATVEDEYDEADSPIATPATTVTATSDTHVEKKNPESKINEIKPRYWVSERKVGEFARSFSFEQRIDLDSVSADLKNGILHVVVPKSLKSRKVVVAVN